jgi:protein-tyrosine-phosphatase
MTEPELPTLEARVAMRHAERRLGEEFPTLEAETVAAVLEASYHHMDEVSAVKAHVALLAERYARGRLWAIVRMEGHRPGVPGVLFLDTHDAGRAKLAKALFVAAATRPVEALSAGTRPDTVLAPTVVTALEELGLVMPESFPKHYTDEMLRAADVLVTFGEGGDLDLPDGLRHEHWDHPDPRHLTLAETRELRDVLDDQVRDLAVRLGVTDAGPAV